MKLEIGQLIDNRYQVIDTLGQGGMGAVYKVYDIASDREIALKILSPVLTQDEETRRFRREFRAIAKLKHPNVISVYDYGIDSKRNIHYFTMDYIKGRDLGKFCSEIAEPREGNFLSDVQLERLINVFIQTSKALSYVHSQGVIHRDIKPGNIMVNYENVVKLMDFGVAKVVDASLRLTRTGTIMGTTFYISPEQAQGHGVDLRSDLYSLGVVLYEALTGKLPFESDDPFSVIFMHVAEMPLEPRRHNPEVPRDLERVVLRLMEKDPADRYQSAGELITALEECRPGVKISAEAISETGITTPKVARPDQIFRAKLIGRDEELESIKKCLERVLKRNGELVIIGGEVGIGKTRLVEELFNYGRPKGLKFITGTCHEEEGSISYQPFIELLRQYFRDVKLYQDIEAVRVVVKGLEPELIKFVPDLSQMVTEVVPSVELPPEQEKSRLFDSICRFLINVSERNPLLLLLDDLQWADEMTLQLLHYVARNIRNSRVLICGTYREEESIGKHPLVELMRRMSRERICQKITLERLSLSETREMIYSLLGTGDLSSDFEVVIYEETEGNPFFIEEVIKSLVQEGVLYQQHGVWRKRLDTGRIEIPSTITDVIGRRLGLLDEESREVLSLAALIGKKFDFDVLMELSGKDEDELLDLIDELLRTQLIREDEVSLGDRYLFAHIKMRDVLYEEINKRRRRRLHRKVGEVIEQLCGDEVEEYIGDLAYHFYQGEEDEKAIEYSLKAGERARGIYANEEAIKFYKMALQLLEKLEDDFLRKSEVRDKLGDTYGLIGEYDKALSYYESALSLLSKERAILPFMRAELNCDIGEIYDKKGDYEEALRYLNLALESLSDRDVEEAGKIYSIMGRVYERTGEYDKALDHHLQALQLAERSEETVKAYDDLGGVYYCKGELDKASEYCERSLEMGLKIGYLQEVANAYNNLRFIYWSKGEMDKALKSAQEALLIKVKIGDVEGIVRAHSALASIYSFRGESEVALDHLQSALEMAKKIGDARGAAISYNDLGLAYWTEDEWDKAIESYKDSLMRFEEIGHIQGIAVVANNLGDIYCNKGDFEQAIKYFEQSIELKEKMGNRTGVALSIGGLGLVYSERGDWKRAIGYYQESLKISEEIGYIPIMIKVNRELARAYANLKEIERAKECFQKALDGVSREDDKLELGRVYRTGGIVYREAGDLDLSEQYFREGMEIFKELDSKYDMGQLYYEFGIYLEKTGDKESAIDYWQDALDVFEAFGAKEMNRKVVNKLGM